MRRIPSVRATLIYWLVIPTIALWISAIAVAGHIAISFSQGAYDGGLEDDAEALSAFVKQNGTSVVFVAPPEARHLLSREDEDDYRFAVFDHEKKAIAQSSLKPLGDDAPSPGYVDLSLGGKNFRRFTLAVPGDDGSEPVAWIRVGESTAQRDALAKKIMLQSLVPLSALLALSVIVVFVGVKRGLKSLDAISADVSAKSPQSLRPIDLTNVPTEVVPLVTSLNSLLAAIAAELKAREQFVGRVAHQMKTPIAAFRAQVEAIERRHTSKEFHEDIENLNLSSARIGRLMTQLLTLSRAEPAETLNCSKAVDLRGILELICRERAFAAGEKRIELSFVGSKTPSSIRGEEQGTYDIAANLIDNALQYSPPGSRVEIGIESAPKNVRLLVRDSGPGIAENEQSRIFERFYRVPGTIGPGNGLGLSIVKELTTKLSATIEIHCPGELGGTDFAVSFPIGDLSTGDRAIGA